MEAYLYEKIEDLGTRTPWRISRFHPTCPLTDREVAPVAEIHGIGL